MMKDRHPEQYIYPSKNDAKELNLSHAFPLASRGMYSGLIPTFVTKF